MTLPSLPSQGSTNWYTWAQALHDAAAEVDSGRLTDDALRAAFDRHAGVADPRDHGVILGADVTDQQATDNAAALAAAVAAGGGVRIPVGELHIKGAVAVTGSGFAVAGVGRGMTRIVQRSDNTPIFQVNGSRLRIEGMSLTWATTQTSAQANSSAVDVVSKGSGGILSNSVIRELDITNCAIGIDLRDSIGYSCSFDNIMVESFAISALGTDSATAWTQSKFGVWHIANQPLPYYTGTAVGGSTTTIQLPASASTTANYYVGMTLVLTGGSGSGSTVRFITAYDVATKTATFVNAASVAVDATTTFSIARQATCSDYPFKLTGFTDAHVGEVAFEFITLPSSIPAPINIDTCQSVLIDTLRYERVVWRATNSALIAATGRTAVVVQSVQSEFSAALTALGVTNFYYARTFAQSTVAFTGSLERNGWVVTANPRWALASAASAGDRAERPYGGTYFRTIPSGDVNLSPVGQSTDFLGARRQTAIIGRPPAGSRGASLDEGNVATYNHNLMDSPDVVRFATPITQDVTFNLDQSNLVAGVTVTVVRDAACTGAFNINIRYQSTTLATLTAPGSSARLCCHGAGYYLIP